MCTSISSMIVLKALTGLVVSFASLICAGILVYLLVLMVRDLTADTRN